MMTNAEIGMDADAPCSAADEIEELRAEVKRLQYVRCPRCHGDGRSLGAPSKWGDGSPTDYGPCQVCGGSGELEQEFECRTLEDLEAEDLLWGKLPPL